MHAHITTTKSIIITSTNLKVQVSGLTQCWIMNAKILLTCQVKKNPTYFKQSYASYTSDRRLISEYIYTYMYIYQKTKNQENKLPNSKIGYTPECTKKGKVGYEILNV